MPPCTVIKPFKEQPIVIDKTAIVVKEINRLAEWTTATYCIDNASINRKTEKLSIFGQTFATLDAELVLITKGKVRAGFDFSTLQEQDIVIDIDSLSISLKLPKVQILDVITNPSDFETFEESGKWSYEEVKGFKNEARSLLVKNALESGIFELAEKNGREMLTALLFALGFKEVNVL
jgi:hypothetical protein